jgi:hypothetical protein
MCQAWGILPSEFESLSLADRRFLVAHWNETQDRRDDGEGGGGAGGVGAGGAGGPGTGLGPGGSPHH